MKWRAGRISLSRRGTAIPGPPTIRPRHAERAIREALRDTRVVIIAGARQVGKSTLAGLVAGEAIVRSLDTPAIRAAAAADPVEFLRHDGLMVIDEAQRVPDLLLAIKHQVDRDPRPGQFFLTGSAHLGAVAAARDALTGRSETIELWPFSQGEIDATPDGLVELLVVHGEPSAVSAGESVKRDYLERVVRGGYPEAVARRAARRRSFHSSYLGDLIDRDVRELRHVRRTAELRRLLSVVAARTGQPLAVGGLAQDATLSWVTAEEYLTLLEAVFLIKRIPAWSSNLTRRPTRQPKVVFLDSGICASVVGHDVARLMEPDSMAGALLETFVLSEIDRQLSWSDAPARLFHYRTRDGVEVDGVIESSDGRIVGVEVKAGATVRNDDFAGLRHLQAKLGDRFRVGAVLYTGPDVLSFGDGLYALPLDSLWRTPPSPV